MEELVSVPNLSEGFGVGKCPTSLKRPELSGPNVISSAKVMKPDIGVVNGDVFHRKEYFLKSNLRVYYTKKFQTVLMFC